MFYYAGLATGQQAGQRFHSPQVDRHPETMRTSSTRVRDGAAGKVIWRPMCRLPSEAMMYARLHQAVIEVSGMAMAAATHDFVDAAPEEVGMSADRLANLRRLVQGYVDSGKLAGAVSVVARRGKVVHFQTYGHMDVEADKHMRPDTIFRLASMTKPIASVGLMTLYEEGAFQLDDPVSRYMPALKDLRVFDGGTADSYTTRAPAHEMTVHDLLRHTSGLVSSNTTAPGPTVSSVAALYQRAGLPGPWFNGSLAEMLAKLSQVPLACDPGSTFIYSIATDVVGYLCEVLSGQSLDKFLQQRVFEPLHMPDTGFGVPITKLDRLAANYRKGAEGEPPYVLHDSPSTSVYGRPRAYLSGANGLVSTAADYLRFCQMLLNGGELDGARVLGPRTLRLMLSNHLRDGLDLPAMTLPGDPVGIASPGTGFGLGFAVLRDPAVAGVVGTPGEAHWAGAYSTYFWVTPSENLAVVFLTQLLPFSAYPIQNQLRATVYPAIID
jgi:CubicO group peptidase (beta-lactamase class C family)